jgi:hypothetical protein
LGVIGFAPGTGLGRDANAFLRFVAKYLLSPLAPHIKYWSTPELTAPVITNVLLNKEGKTGIYCDEKGHALRLQIGDEAFRKAIREQSFGQRVASA